MKSSLWAGALLSLALLLSACAKINSDSASQGTVPPSGGLVKNDHGYVDISVDQLATLMENKDFTLVNVHIPYEGELPQTDLFIPFDEIQNHLDELPAKGAPIVLYCRSGSMSTTAAKVLAADGYTNVMELDGGFNAWKGKGYEFLDKR